MDKRYNLKLDLQFKCNNSIIKFNQFDNNTSDFFMRITNGGNLVDIEKAIVVLAVIKPSGKVDSQFVEVENGLVYADLKPNMRDEIGIYTAQAMLILEDERVVTDAISYEVEEDKIFSLLNDTVEATEEFTVLTDMLSRLSTIEISEEQRVINEAERILSEENRKTEEAKRVEAELIRQHEEADRTKYDATRESNENIRKQNESIRLTNETNRIDEEAKRVEEEANRVEAEQLRKDNYNFMTEDEERRKSEANAHKEAEALRVQAETDRVNEEAKRRTTEQSRVLAENTRVSNENTRIANEKTRQNKEAERVEAETQRQNRYNSFIADAEANANNFENYTNTAKVKEEERKSNELDRKSQEARRVSNEVERISNENTRKANEVAREKNETSRQYVFENKVNEVDKKIIEINATKDNFVSSINTKVDNKISELDNAKSDMTNTVSNKVNEVETRFNALTSSQQQDAEVIDARDGETSLKARLDRDIEKAKQVYLNVEGSNISTDSSSGYAKDVEILGNTIQNSENLADIRSVGDTVEGQELYEIPVVSCGKNIYKHTTKTQTVNGVTYTFNDDGSIQASGIATNYNAYLDIWILSETNLPEGTYTFSGAEGVNHNGTYWGCPKTITISKNDSLRIYVTTGEGNSNNKLYKPQIEEGTVATPYEPYVEDKLTILSPVQLEKVGDVADRIICKDGVWGVEKNVDKFDDFLNCNLSVWSSQNTDTGVAFYITSDLHNQNVNAIISNKFLYDDPANNKNNFVGNSYRMYILRGRIPKDGLSSENATGVKEYLHSIGAYVKYVVASPTFIPLPHDQQVKLRTFANKTNISFLTEIEGTIKAQVPKSIGATVNTHTEQINNLNKELDRVKKLEESTVSTVTTESDFTIVEATSNGYFEDVKLEGKTLVNLVKGTFNKNTINSNSSGDAWLDLNINLEANKLYTIVLTISNKIVGTEPIKFKQRPINGGTSFQDNNLFNLPNGTYAKLFIPTESYNRLSLYYSSNVDNPSSCDISNAIILEGDHTQNPPSYFEGLKSVGQSATTSEDGVDEVSVESVNENLLDISMIKYLGDSSANTVPSIQITDSGFSAISNIEGCGVGYVVEVPLSGDYTLSYTNLTNATVHYWSNLKNDFIPNLNDLVAGDRISIDFKPKVSGSFCADNIQFSFGKKLEYTPYQSDKKRLLYYNEETQTWEKPILRQWDSIEKHADGKYYYHQRSGEVVLDGGQGNNWQLEKTNTNTLVLRHPNLKCIKNNENINVICDKFNPVKHSVGWVLDSECIHISIAGELHINISRSNANSLEDALNFLNSTNITVVYQLAQEKVYECTNIDLITYANETNFIVESGAIVPRTTLKVHNNISNVVSLLQKKVSLLESNVKASQEVQDMMILETDMRILDIELALMEFIPMKLNLGGSNMLRSATYFNFLKNHIINETYEKEYLENVMNKYLATGRINQDEYNELYKMLYPPVYDIELPIEY